MTGGPVTRLPFGVFNGERRRRLDLSGFSVSEFVDRPDETIARHTHDDAHFCIVLKGSYITSAEGLDGSCLPPAVIFVPAGTTHHDRFHTRGGSFLALSIAPTFIERLGSHRLLAEEAFGVPNGELPWLGSRVYGELRQMDEGSPIVLEGLALELLAIAARGRARRVRADESWLRAAFQLIQDSYADKLTVQGIAAAVGVRPLLLGRSFRKAFGCSPGEMLRRRRVHCAQELLRRREIPIAEIALTTGYADQAQLTKAFRRVTGFTPGRFRRLFSA